MTASAPSVGTPQATASTPASALLAARLGGALALVAAASLSFNALCDLARRAGLGGLAALLPIAIDAFAASALFVAYRLPLGHPARRTTGRTARLALALTVGCNGLDHLLDLASYLLTRHVRDLLLVAVASLPPLIVERLLHLQTALVGDHRLDASETVRPQTAVADNLVGNEQDDSGLTGHATTYVARPTRTRPDDERWLALADPVYRALMEQTGRRPTESAFHAALSEAMSASGAAAGCGADGDDVVRRISLSTAKRVRALVEDHETRKQTNTRAR
ncbi:DUF2637 domain-containing protein [Catenulispora pinisilvae]|uniref:DUF2637 domain-containing protein n=1 Tax=Catenulispora pinisilvae TaxID=2705253 RepID=UPI0018917BE1|nr:DUF2637 domain-containing protein [Catenulispora pinisilvae]